MIKRLVIIVLIIVSLVFCFKTKQGKNFVRRGKVLVSDLFDGGKTLYDTYFFVVEEKEEMHVMSVMYIEDQDIFYWVGYLQYGKIKVPCEAIFPKPPEKLKKVFLSGKYKIKMRVVYNVYNKKVQLYPKWIKTIKVHTPNKIEVLKLKNKSKTSPKITDKEGSLTI